MIEYNLGDFYPPDITILICLPYFQFQCSKGVALELHCPSFSLRILQLNNIAEKEKNIW